MPKISDKGLYTGPAPTTEYVEDCARGTLQEWFGSYVEVDSDAAEPAVTDDGQPFSQWYVQRVGEEDPADLYRFSPAGGSTFVNRTEGAVYRVQVLVERVPEL